MKPWKLGVAIGLVLAGGSAVAEETPGPWWLARMQRDLPAESMVRVRSMTGNLIVSGARPDSLGIQFDRLLARDRGLDAAANIVSEAPTPIPWSAIDRVDVARSGTSFGTVLGGAIGAALAVAIGWSGGYDQESKLSAVQPAAIIVGGAALGRLIGSHQKRWRVYYPPPLDPLYGLKP